MILRRAIGIATANVDGVLLGMLGLLLGIGITVLYSASNESMARVSGQLINIGVAFAIMWLAAKVPPNHLMRIALPAYLFGLILLVGVALFGEVTNGARRWLNIGITRIQPSELM
jgi:rod shape determining protein RodA